MSKGQVHLIGTERSACRTHLLLTQTLRITCRKFLDVLTGVSDDDSGSENSRGSGTDTGSGGDGGAKPPKRTKVDIDLERLRAHGYTGGPSVLLIPELQPEQAANWDW